MGKVCPSCGQGTLEELVPGIVQCTHCKKVFQAGGEEKEKQKEEGEFIVHDGEYWLKNTSLNKNYDVPEKGITVFREKNKRWLAVILCHSGFLQNYQYLRISWFKQSLNKHAGMFKIESLQELDNVIIALERIDRNFDENFKPIGNISFEPIPARKDVSRIKLFDEKKRMCPNCKVTKMKLSKNKKYYECVRCGEIIVLQDGKPIYNIPDENLTLAFSTNFPINYYLPDYGITTHYNIANWKAVVIIHSKDNPEKKWLRFYWWERNLQAYINSNYTFGVDGGLKWEAKRGLSSPNIFEKENVRKLIEVLYKMREIWAEEKNIELDPIEIPPY